MKTRPYPGARLLLCTHHQVLELKSYNSWNVIIHSLQGSKFFQDSNNSDIFLELEISSKNVVINPDFENFGWCQEKQSKYSCRNNYIDITTYL